MVLKLTIFDGLQIRQILISNSNQLSSFLCNLKLTPQDSFIAQQQRSKILDSTQTLRYTMTKQQLLKFYNYFIYKNEDKLLVSNLFIVRGYDPNQLLQLNPETLIPNRTLSFGLRKRAQSTFDLASLGDKKIENKQPQLSKKNYTQIEQNNNKFKKPVGKNQNLNSLAMSTIKKKIKIIPDRNEILSNQESVK